MRSFPCTNITYIRIFWHGNCTWSGLINMNATHCVILRHIVLFLAQDCTYQWKQHCRLYLRRRTWKFPWKFNVENSIDFQFSMKNVGNFRRLRRPAASNDIFSKINLGKLRKSSGNDRKFAACGGDFFQFSNEKLGFFFRRLRRRSKNSQVFYWKFPKM